MELLILILLMFQLRGDPSSGCFNKILASVNSLQSIAMTISDCEFLQESIWLIENINQSKTTSRFPSIKDLIYSLLE